MKNRKPSFTFIDLFAGIGGMRRGFESVGGRCVYTSEWNKYSVQTYKANFSCNHHIETGDIQEVPIATIPKHDVLVAGFPCQPFSLAGVSKKGSLGREHGFACKAQGTLFFTLAKILKEKQPGAFLLENVKNLKSHDRGNTFKVIMEALQDELDYEVHHRIIDARGFVPQHRERIFIVGFRKDAGVKKVFDFEKMIATPFDSAPTLSSILHRNDEPLDEPYTLSARGRIIVNPKYTLSDHLWGYLQEYKEKHRLKGNGFGYGLFGNNDVARTLSARYHKDGAEILIKQRGKKGPRRLTPRECARLMGFEKEGCQDFRIPVSDTQAYRQFGNAVVVPVIEAIARHMKPHIIERIQDPQLPLELPEKIAVNQ